MKINELRIGNYVSDTVFQYQIEKILKTTVWGIVTDIVKAERNEDYYQEENLYHLDIKNIEGILLTENWLKKTGLISESNYRNKWFIDNIEIPEWIKYIHELQNWYYWKFMKIELEIKL